MPDYLPTIPYKGTRDFLPEEMSVRTQVFHRLYAVLESYGFLRYDGPILESAEIYEAKSGREIAEQQLYSCTDRSGRRLALRPEMTPSVARIIAGNAATLRFPVRWYSHPNCFRYEQPQRGRKREHWQLNVDIFGSGSMWCEIEIFEIIHDLMSAIGAKPDMWKLRVNDRILLESLLTDLVGIPPEKLSRTAQLIDRWEKYEHEQLESHAREIGVTANEFARLVEVLGAGEAVLPEIPADVRERSTLVKILATDAADLVTYDPLIVRAFEYYTSTVFEVFDTNPANSRSLFGGGRYDNLTTLFSSQRIPGIGFAMGDVTMHDFLDVHGLLPEPRSEIDIVVVPLDPALIPAARTIAKQLRAKGLRVNTPLESRKLAKELSRTAQAGAHTAVILGPKEWANGEVIVRDLATHQQRCVPLSAVSAGVGA